MDTWTSSRFFPRTPSRPGSPLRCRPSGASRTARSARCAEAPDVVRVAFLHGGGQNAHTWDTVILGLGLPALAIDLPGHGHSEWREDGDYGPKLNAASVEPVIRELAPEADLVVGMSLGGLTAMRGRHRPRPRPQARHGRRDSVGPRSSRADDQGAVGCGGAGAGRTQFPQFRGDGGRRRRRGRTVPGIVAARRFTTPSNSTTVRGRGGTTAFARAKASKGSGTTYPPCGCRPPWCAGPGPSSSTTTTPPSSPRTAPGFRQVIVVPDAGHSVQGDQPRALVEILRSVLD